MCSATCRSSGTTVRKETSNSGPKASPRASASFAPTVLHGTETTSTLTLTVADNAPLGEATGLLEAEPKTVKAGSIPSTVPITLSVAPPFSVYVGLASSIPASTTVTAPPCSTTAVGVRTTVEAPFAGPVSMSLSTEGDAARGCWRWKNFLASSDFGGVGENEQALRITRNGNGPASGAFKVLVTGSNGPFVEPAATVNVERGLPIVNSISASVGWAPVALQPGTLVTLKGSGFCPGTTVQFGNAKSDTRRRLLTTSTPKERSSRSTCRRWRPAGR